jgi:hypothetical protein
MAAGPFTLFHIGQKKFVDAVIDIDSHVFKCMLTGAAQALAANFVGASGDCRRSDLTSEVVGSGYPAGGIALAITTARFGAVVTVDAVDFYLPNTSVTAKYAVMYDDTNGAKDLLGFVNLNPAGGSVAAVNGQFALYWSPSGLFTVV